MKACLIISVYKNVDALRCILDNLKHQTEQDFEIIISEDGQSQEMKTFVESYPFRQPYQHLTQPDEGWRKNRALNRAIRASHCNWLIFIDGDCVLHPRFIEMHVRYANPQYVLAGKRIKLNIVKSALLLTYQSFSIWPLWFFPQGCRHIEDGFFFPFAKWLRRPIHHLIGCNMSMSKQVLEQINGFDEQYIYPTVGEDTDIEWRLQAIGVQIYSLRNLAVQYHLYHPCNYDTERQDNVLIFERKQAHREIIAKQGLCSHS